jgi:hypothetical protein
VIEAYLDESNTHRGTEILCVASYAGTRDQWHYFEKEFQVHLDNAGISLFHAKESKCDKIRPALTEIIINAELKGIVCFINPNEYKEYAGANLRSELGNPYAICAYGCSLGVAAWRLENKLEPVAVVLEAGQTNVDRVEKVLKLMIDDPIYPIASVSVASKEKYLPLQAADFLAHIYCTRDREWLDKLNTKNQILYTTFPLEQIKEVSEQIKQLHNRQRNLRKLLKKEELASL